MARIRRAVADDEAALRALDLATWSWLTSPAAPPPPDREFFGPRARPEDVFVAIVDGALAGYVTLGPGLPLESNRHVMEVVGLMVDPTRRGRGLGRALMEAAIDEAAARGARRLRLRVLGPNAAARALYESCGFEVEGVLREEFVLDGRYVDDVLMAMNLRGSGRR